MTAQIRKPSLSAPFANTSELTKGGRTFTYIPASEVIERLNAVLGYGGWSYECELVHLDADFAVVKGRLHALGQVYEQFGGQRINKNKQGEPIDLGDDLKGAASDAEKKAAQMIGVGLYLSLGRNPTPFSAVQPTAEPASHAAGDGGRAGQSPITDLAPAVDSSTSNDQGETTPPQAAVAAENNSAVAGGDTDGGAGSFGEAGTGTAVLQLNLDIQGLKGRARAEAMGEKSRLKITDLDGIDPESEEFKLLRAKTTQLMESA